MIVPPVVHLIWLQGYDRLPAHLARQTETWAEHHPGWTVRWWDHDQLRDLDMPYGDLWDRAGDIVPADAVAQFRSDLGRWCVLRDFGGVYSDTDVRVQRPIGGLLDAPMVVGWEIQDRWIGSSVIAAVPGHPATDAVIGHIDAVTRSAKPGTRPNRLSGPKAITPVLRDAADVKILPEKCWYPVPWDRPLDADRPHPDAFLVHTWEHQRTVRGLHPEVSA